MTPDEAKMQARKIRLMKIAMFVGILYGLIILHTLMSIDNKLGAISEMIGIVNF